MLKPKVNIVFPIHIVRNEIGSIFVIDDPSYPLHQLLFPFILLCLSGLNLMEGKLNKEQWQRFPSKPYDAKAK